MSEITFDPKHKVWQWLQGELPIFLPLSQGRSFLKSSKKACSSFLESARTHIHFYPALVNAISEVLSPIVLTSFLHEMNCFLLYDSSYEDYKSEQNVKMMVTNLPEDPSLSIVIQDGKIRLRLLTKLITRSIFKLEHEILDEAPDLSTFQEMSHIHFLVDGTSSDQVFTNIEEFIRIRLQRLGRNDRSSLPCYLDSAKFQAVWLPIYIDCYHHHRTNHHQPPSQKIKRDDRSHTEEDGGDSFIH